MLLQYAILQSEKQTNSQEAGMLRRHHGGIKIF